MTRSYLVFRIGSALYGVEASLVREVFLLPELTSVAEAPAWVAGLLNLRGKVMPVVDPVVRLGGAPSRRLLTDVVIVIEQPDDGVVGILVDEVLEVREIDGADTETSPHLRLQEKPLLAGRMARSDRGLIALLNVDELLSPVAALPAPALSVEEPLPVQVEGYAPAELAVLRERAHSLAQTGEERAEERVAPLAIVALNNEWFGVDLECVREFADLRVVTPVPCCPEHVIGTVNLRGELLTLVDIRKALLMPAPEGVQGSKMVVVQFGEVRAGVVVDEVLDVLHLSAADLAPVPYSVRSSLEEHVAGMASCDDKMVAILDLQGIFNREDWVVDAEP